MVNLTFALEEMKGQLVEVVRGALEKGFELVAGTVGGKMAKTMEVVFKQTAVNVKNRGQAGVAEMAGLREQIKENAAAALPWMTTKYYAIGTSGPITLVTSGFAETGGIRALLLEGNAPHQDLVMWSNKHAHVVDALADLLELTQVKLKQSMSNILNRDPYSPDPNGYPGNAYPTSFEDGYAVDEGYVEKTSSTTATSPTPYGNDAKDDAKLFWDADLHHNPGFTGFDYASFCGHEGEGAAVNGGGFGEFKWT